jgi:ubiquinone/menaquinone biosynthesis C-methylase UbiE
MREINLRENSPKTERIIKPGWRKEENKIIAKRYDQDFFDGERINGYGGYYYDGRWRSVVEKLKKLYHINNRSSVLDVGCAKGFLLFDLQEMLPGIKVAGIDISRYAVNKAMDGYANCLIKQGYKKEEADNLEERARRTILPHMIIGSAEYLPWPDKSFDAVLSITTLHNLTEDKMKKAIQEMNRVCRNPKNMFIEVDAYRTPEEKERMKNWVLTAETVKSVGEWIKFFNECKYKGDYYWMIA